MTFLETSDRTGKSLDNHTSTKAINNSPVRNLGKPFGLKQRRFRSIFVYIISIPVYKCMEELTSEDLAGPSNVEMNEIIFSILYLLIH